jgi:predicted XRE-type DNA-binding protein
MSADGVAAMKIYNVHAKRWERGWELHIPDVGVTQSHGLWDAEAMARDYIEMRTEADPASFEVCVVPQIGGGLDEAAVKAREAVHQAEEAQRAAATQSRSVARRLSQQGLSGRDISKVLGVSPQRVSQLLRNEGQRATSG